VQPAPALPELIHGTTPNDDWAALSAEGYVVIGQSSFNGAKFTDEQAIEQGKVVGADRVVIYSKFSSAEHTAIPLTLPTTQTSVTNGSATAYGSGGTATAYGSAVTTTYGTQTTYVPMTIRRYDAFALYVVKEKYAFGAIFREVNPSESQRIGTVNGVALTSIVRGSPAAAAGFLPGDILTKADGSTVVDSKMLSAFLAERQGRTVTLTVYRDGKASDVPVTIGSY